MRAKAIQVVGFLSLAATTAFALNNGLGQVPPMGFNTWRAYECNFNETVLKQQA